jgi:hypothetical protein
MQRHGALVVVATLAACSGGDDGSGPAAAGTTADVSSSSSSSTGAAGGAAGAGGGGTAGGGNTAATGGQGGSGDPCTSTTIAVTDDPDPASLATDDVEYTIALVSHEPDKVDLYVDVFFPMSAMGFLYADHPDCAPFPGQLYCVFPDVASGERVTLAADFDLVQTGNHAVTANVHIGGCDGLVQATDTETTTVVD